MAIVKKNRQILCRNRNKPKMIKAKIEYQDISWTKKEIIDILKIGDVIYVKKLKKKFI